jgi:predicted enzyme related to lactoylglutathione lyase
MSDSKVQGLGQVAVYVKDLPAAIGFYRDCLGLSFLFEAGGMAFFDLHGTRLMLTQPNAEDSTHRASVLYFRVGDIDTAWQNLLRAGGKAKEAPQQIYAANGIALWLAFFEDSSGNIMAFMEERRIS